MKSKKLTYFLMLAAAVTWGKIAWDVFPSINEKSPSIARHQKREISHKRKTTEPSLELKMDYRNPFGPVTEKPSKGELKKPKEEEVQKVKILSPIPWPKVQYKGWVVSKEKQVAMLEIEGKHLLMSPGERKSEVLLLMASENKVNLEWKGNQKTFQRK